MHDICTRCHAMIPPDVKPGQHICADVAKRHARRAAQRDAVVTILLDNGFFDGARAVAEHIVEVLARMGVDRD